MTSKPKAGDLIYFGLPDRSIFFDGAFRILDANKTNTGEPGMFLLCENLISKSKTNGFYFLNEKKPKGNSYRSSDAQCWCEEFSKKFFTEPEYAAMLPTYKSDNAYTKIHQWEILGGKTRDGECPFVAAPNILNGDRVFLLSSEEADSPAYGFDGNASRLAGLDGTAAAWWLRSPHAPDFPIDVGFVFFNGWLLDFTENQDNVFGIGPACMRPAFNLDTSKIVSVEAVGASNNEWLVRLSGESDEAYEAKRSRFTYGARRAIEAKEDPSGPAKFFTDLAITVFIYGVDLYRKITGKV